MAYTAVPTQNTGDEWTAAEHNTYVRDNFAAGVPDIFTTKGDLAVATAADTAARLAVGTDGHVLIADSGEACGIKWGTVPNGPSTGVGARYYVDDTQEVADSSQTIIDYAVKDYDTDTAVTVGAAWKFTVPADQGGKYLVIATCYYQSAGWLANERADLELYKNGARVCIMGSYFVNANNTVNVFVIGSAIVDLSAADYIDVRAYQNSGDAQQIDSDGEFTHIAIAKLYS